jgi:hypothetical protein
LGPQKAKSFSLGVELAPQSVQGLKVGVNYYRIDYRDQIAAPPSDPSVLLANPGSFSSLILRDPTDAQVNQAVAAAQLGAGLFDCDIGCVPDANFDPGSIEAILDFRRRNLSVVSTRGLDLSTQYAFQANGSDIRLGLESTYILELEQQVTATSAPLDRVNTFNNPPHWRLRGSSGWSRQGWAANLFVNYVSSYRDNRLVPSPSISSYTTVDVRGAYDFGEHAKSGALSGLTIAVSAQNVLDHDPPPTAIVSALTDMGFDPTNANPMGRLIAIELVKAW